MNSNKFILIFFSTFILSISGIILVNFFVDPGNIYYRGMIIRKKKEELLQTFKNSKLGVYYNGNERFFKTLLAQESTDTHCFVIGSSRIMQLSSIRSPNIKKNCESVLNLGVSGASFEDILIFLDFIQKNKMSSSKRIIIGIDPWTLKFSMDGRYATYKDNYESFLQRHNLSSLNKKERKNNYNEILNLINLEYTVLSFKRIFKSRESSDPHDALYSAVLDKNDPAHYEDAMTLPDGSHLYSNQYIEKNETNEDYSEIPDYKLNGEVFDEATVSLFSESIKALKDDFKIVLLLTPYHQSAFSPEKRKYHKYFNETEKLIHSLGNKLNIKVFGSFNPKNIGCQADEFYDFMHPKSSCINRIFEQDE